MSEWKERFSAAGKTAALALRLAGACVLFAAFLQIGGNYLMPLALGGLALTGVWVYLCSFKVNGFGLAFGLLLEHFSFTGQAASIYVQAGLMTAAFALYFASLTRPPQSAARP